MPASGELGVFCFAILAAGLAMLLVAGGCATLTFASSTTTSFIGGLAVGLGIFSGVVSYFFHRHFTMNE